MWQYGSEFAGFRKSEIERETKQLHDTVAKQQTELAELRTRLAAAERQAQIEIASQGEVAKQVKTLSGENAKLKEDLAFFQSVLPVSGRDEAVSIGRFKLEPEYAELRLGKHRRLLTSVKPGPCGALLHLCGDSTRCRRAAPARLDGAVPSVSLAPDARSSTAYSPSGA